MASDLNEDTVNALTDLFAACKLMQKFSLDLKGLTSLDDAKCRLLRHIRQTTTEGEPSRRDASEVMQSVLSEDVRKRGHLVSLYGLARDLLVSLPRPRREELELQVPGFASGLADNLATLQRSDCAILIAGEVSAGKSSLLNLLLGEHLLPTSLLSCTSVICELRHSTTRYAVAHPTDVSTHPVYVDLSGDDPHTELAPYVHCTQDRNVPFQYSRVEIFWPLPLLKGGIIIVDSPGIGENREVTQQVKDYLTSAFAFIYVINSSNAGGLQPDRLQDLLAALVYKRQEDEMSTFDPRSAVFVCNKWDQIPASEAEVVRRDTEEKLAQCWPGVDKKQIFYISTTQASRSLTESNFVTKDLAALLEGIEDLLPVSLQYKLETHYRWLSQVLRRTAFVLRVHMSNETRSDLEREELIVKLREQMDQLESESKVVGQTLEQYVCRSASTACDQLIAHLASASTRARLLHWGSNECPDAEDWESLHELIVAKVHKRIRKEVSEWDVKNGIFEGIQKDLVQTFQEAFQLMENQLDFLEDDMIGVGKATVFDTLRIRKALKTTEVEMPAPSLTFSQKLVLGAATPVLLPLGVMAGVLMLPFAGLRALRAKMEDMRLINAYRESKTETMASMTDEILESFLDTSSISKLVQDQLNILLQNLKTMIESIPRIIQADRALVEKLACEREAHEHSLSKDYAPLYDKCAQLQGKLDLFYATDIRHYDVDFDNLEWSAASPPIACGSFGDVYKARWTKPKCKPRDVAIKIPRETLSVHNVTDMLLEESIFRRLDHVNVVAYLGTSVRRSKQTDNRQPNNDNPAVDNVQIVMMMELCNTTLMSRIPSSRPDNPGRLEPGDPGREEAVRRVARFAKEISSALLYLHGKSYVHRDLKPSNILLTDDDVVKLADVGHTRRERDISGTRCGSGCYTAPEILSGIRHGCSADIFSLGIILWELWYGRRASDEMSLSSAKKYKEDPQTAMMMGVRPSLGNLYEPDAQWKNLIRQCWHQEAEERPKASECYKFFTEITSDETDD